MLIRKYKYNECIQKPMCTEMSFEFILEYTIRT